MIVIAAILQRGDEIEGAGGYLCVLTEKARGVLTEEGETIESRHYGLGARQALAEKLDAFGRLQHIDLRVRTLIFASKPNRGQFIAGIRRAAGRAAKDLRQTGAVRISSAPLQEVGRRLDNADFLGDGRRDPLIQRSALLLRESGRFLFEGGRRRFLFSAES
ncbi:MULTISPECIES: hypothetical protein [Methylosinus]|uniref:hypothetical protein n=1 Tax=Methylosinus TaxID=425 RepID=UPI00046561E0|nr:MULTISPECIES: hypothetical protein [Methylosinus]OBS53509.1 hypothetical protein A8B73_05490 [Methylosinus sp. 3S-1]